MLRSASDLYNQVVEAAQNQELWERSRAKPGENEIRCSAPFWIYIKRVVEAKQNQELWERSQTKPGENPCKLFKSISIKSDVPLHFEFVLSELWKPNKTRGIHANCSCTKVRMKSDVPLCFGFTYIANYKLSKTL